MRPLLIYTTVAMLCVAAGAAWFFHPSATSDQGVQGEATSSPNWTSDVQSAAGALKPHRAAPAGEREFYSEAFHFSLFYPADLVESERNEGGGAITFSFQNTATAQGFQIFVVPYAGSQVSTSRFAQDEPSGVMQSPQNVTIDGATGSSFFGQDAALGDTAEVWFIHGGYLYEVTSLRPLASWLSQIMSTWEFL